ncbi:hypothetical protein CN311_08230 [Mesorhizobium sanjuanii]|uniref:Uncharacterized protein n=1 Tax=Mesorhizobium sanjuanii TaxID=2037900 RepID=A0A2A6FI35_9HYPH|nr:hypothetical protein CN311_08230 [Mesorhizobium sanjuanii]
MRPSGDVEGTPAFYLPHDVGPIGPDRNTPLEREMPLVNTLPHHRTFEALAGDGVPNGPANTGQGG